MIEIKITMNKQDMRRIELMPERAEKGLYNGLKKAVLFAERKAKQNFNKPGMPKVRTGNLRRSIKSGVKGNTGWIGTDVVYGRIIEEGGTVVPKTKPYLTFQIGNNWVKKKSVKIPPRPYLEPAVRSNQKKLGDIIIKEIIEELNNG